MIKILLLEHDTHDLVLILRELNRSGLQYTHEIAGDEKTFRDYLESFLPDIILSDYSLPSFDGISAFQIKEKLHPEIPFIIVSGTVGEERAVELIKLGVTDYVLKDKLFVLIAKINRALKESKQKKEKAIVEQNLIRSERRLAEAQAIAHIGNWEMDFLTGICIWSDETFAILGLKQDEIVPSLQSFLSFIHPEDVDYVKETIKRNEEWMQEFSYSNRIIRKDGELRYLFTACRFTLTENGKPARITGIIHDVTASKKLEEELKASNKELETFIYRASHDLRGPLSSIIGLTRVSKNEITDAKSTAYFKMVETSAKKLDDTLILLVQSMTMRDMSVTCEEINCKELIREILDQLQFHEGFSRIKIMIDAEEKIWSSKMILGSVFQNLIQNAIKYQNHQRAESFLKISISRKDNNIVEFVFKDNGIGIDDELQEKIFGMYFRATTSGSGSGLGLYIVKIGIEKLGGNIELKSKKGEGSIFIVRLPDNCKC